MTHDFGVPLGESGSRQYPNAPIVEAVLEMRVTTPDRMSLDDLAAAVPPDLGYGDRKPFNEFTGQFDVREAGGVTAQAQQQQTGYLWQSSDGIKHVQCRRDAFLYLQRAPYSHWGEFVAEAERMWGHFKTAVDPTALTRIGVRFVNRVDIPSASVELRDYFRTTAEVSPDLPQMISGFLLQVQLPEVREGVSCTIISTLVPPPSADKTSVILDIDVWCEPKTDPAAPSFDREVRRWLGELRLAKNVVFEACITDLTRRLFV